MSDHVRTCQHETLLAMMDQEERFYSCPNYMSNELQARSSAADTAAVEQSPSSVSCTCTCDRSFLALHMLHEIANLVTDHNQDQDTIVLHKQQQNKKGVGKSPSAVSVRDLLDSSTEMTACDATSPSIRRTASPPTTMHQEECCSLCQKPVFQSPANTDYDTSSIYQQHEHYPEDSFAFWRQQMFDWSCTVIDSYGMAADRTELLASTFSLLDRYVAHELAALQRHEKSTKQPKTTEFKSETTAAVPITRDDFQLFGMTALYMALKLHASSKLSLDAMVHMSRGFYSQQDVCVTEMEMLTALQWRLHAPTAAGFCEMYVTDLLTTESDYDNATMQCEDVKKQLQFCCGHLMELAIADAYLVGYKASAIGLAAVVLGARLAYLPDTQVQAFLAQQVRSSTGALDEAQVQRAYRRLELLYFN